jgi:hypothetical protein
MTSRNMLGGPNQAYKKRGEDLFHVESVNKSSHQRHVDLGIF